MVKKNDLQTTAIILPVFSEKWREDILLKNIDQEVNFILSKKAEQFGFSGKKGEVLNVFASLPAIGFSEIFLLGIGKKSDFAPFIFQQTVADSLRKISTFKIKKAIIFLLDRYGMSAFELGKLLSEAHYLSQYNYTKYKTTEEETTKKVEEFDLMLHPLDKQTPLEFDKEYASLKEGADLAKQICQSVYQVRDLVNEPAAHQSPKQIVAVAEEIARKSNGLISVKILGREECEKLGMGCFLSVAKGSSTEPKFIVLHYRGGPPSPKATAEHSRGNRVCLIGKTITFDSGGLSIKPSKSMETMKMDMAGGATVLGIFNLLGGLGKSGELGKSGVEVFGILPACENMISGSATRPGDIATALNSKSVEILNTDAEGRLALADALSYAEKYIKPDYIIDLATLTGAIITALGDDIAGLFSNDEKLTESLKKAALGEGELLWPMPMHKEYASKIKSKIADLRNISSGSGGGAITAAIFLNEFVKNTKWAHIDIAGVAFNEGEGKGLTPNGGTGWGVKTIWRWLKDNFE